MPRSCDVCQMSNAVLFCRADAAYLCMDCDVKVHEANKLASRHERVWMCEVCEQAPAVFACKADAAVLCVSCDLDIHSANPLARRHERAPVTPFFESPSMVKLAHINVVVPSTGQDAILHEEDEDIYAAEAASWLLKAPNDGACKDDPPADRNGYKGDASSRAGDSVNSQKEKPKQKANPQRMEFFADGDSYVELEYASSMGGSHVPVDSLVPVHISDRVVQPSPAPSGGTASLESELSCKAAYTRTAASALSYSLSSSSMDVGVVPDASQSDLSTPKMSHFPLGQHIFQIEPMAREARVLRYKEKRKNRKFEKTIRYASRKAYAETRPRIKGRFAKRSDGVSTQTYSLVPDAGFVVPSC